MQGLVLSGMPPRVPSPIDFAVSNAGKSAVVLSEWWTFAWGLNDGVCIFTGDIVRAGEVDGSVGAWHVEAHDAWLTGLDEEDVRVVRNARLQADIRRDEYLRALDRLTEVIGDELAPEVTKWRDMYAERPVYDVLKEQEKLWAIPRVVGRVFLNDENGKVDVLVIDERGDAVVLNETSWLSAFADMWTDRPETKRPEVADFIAWIMERRPPTVQTLDGPVVETATGPLVSIAERAFGLATTSEK